MIRPSLRTAALLILFLFLAAGFAPVQAQTLDPIYREDFEDGQAQEWDLSSGWQVILDGDNHVLAGQEHVWANSNHGYDDYRVSFRVRVLRGNVLFNFRVQGEKRYFVDFQESASILNKQTGPDAFQEGIVRGTRSHPLDAWRQVEIDGQGGTLTFSVDGVTEWTYTDPDPFLDGSFAFESLADSTVYIDDVTVTLAPTSAYLPDPGAASAEDLIWVRTGGPSGGLGYDVRMRQDNPDQMLVTDANAGVFISSDGGVIWAPSNEGITTRAGRNGELIPIFCLTIDPTDPDVVWAGTQDARGIFKSQDGGLTWEKRDSGIVEDQGITFRGFTIDPTNPDVVYAAAELASYAWNGGQPKTGREFDLTQGVVYKTTDGGLNWTPIWRGGNLARYIWIDPRDTKVLYVSTGIFDREAASSDPAAGIPGGEGVLKSTDAGVTWAQVNTGLNNWYVGSLFMNPSNPDVLLAGTGNNQYFENAGAYLTVDGGASWKQVISGENIQAVEFAAGNPDVAYAAGIQSIYRSSDGGQTWMLASGGGECTWGPPGVCVGFPIDLQVDPRSPDRLFVNAYGGGNFVSNDGGKTWADASRGYTGAMARAVAVDPQDPARVIAAARSGLFLSRDGGTTWEGLNFPPIAFMDWTLIAWDPSDAGHLIAGTNWDNRLANSVDGGQTWEIVYDMTDQKAGFKAVAFAPSDPGVVYAGTAGYVTAGSFDPKVPGKGILASRDGGKTWTPANDGLSADASVSGLAMDPGDPQVVYAATANHGLLKTVDGGASWQNLQGGLPDTSALSVAVNPGDPNIIFAGFERQGLYISSDGGATWTQSVRGMAAESAVSAIVFDPTDSQNIVYAADSSSGVYRSTNAGKTWTLLKTGMTNRSINSLAISVDGLHLYAASEGSGVFRLDVSGEPPAPVSKPASSGPHPAANASSTAPAADPAPSGPAPVSKPSAGLPCGSAAILPAAVLGLAWIRRRREGC